jgi:hypothetical protein
MCYTNGVRQHLPVHQSKGKMFMENEPPMKFSNLGFYPKCPHCKNEEPDIKVAIDDYLHSVNGPYEVVYCNHCKVFLGCSLTNTQLAP